ncbi:hypothetical protein E1H24_15060 [Clostridioides difficile]|uniref:hypothetical protein n=1 Tax=Clostridioides difficile TaxID=1496 RepID=UPI00093A0C13|nr:hypothetical protein [Clostridioides difficile]EGT4823282.1 hypothetical protein [Clostridioides difficile]EGT5247486.1 hypothetical protein [Clostridioides difficile]MBF9873620.1 hypothetical protein [Clostridioides difficile]MBG0097537.1 hypothetical protein [Clostridioides difficile]MBG0206536.1 hypothetical protein [Clostridioides difficile]
MNDYKEKTEPKLNILVQPKVDILCSNSSTMTGVDTSIDIKLSLDNRVIGNLTNEDVKYEIITCFNKCLEGINRKIGSKEVIDKLQ